MMAHDSHVDVLTSSNEQTLSGGSQLTTPLAYAQSDDAAHLNSMAGSVTVGEHMKDVINTINELERLGLRKLDITLPRCVVLGDQSTGKSSVIEAISGITTPRADDTCTRCPLFIKMGPCVGINTKWTASVSLRRDYEPDASSGDVEDSLFPGWRVMAKPEEVFFKSTESSSELTTIIARAQLAIISPRYEVAYFTQAQEPDVQADHCYDFSPNIVCINIEGPGVPNLSFYDLPGIIGQSEDPHKQFLVKFVKNLVIQYIQDEQSLVLLTCQLSSDIATSTAAGLARERNAVDRCIGVLTKPDCRPASSWDDKMHQVFEGKRFQLGHGYFVVKNLSQQEIDNGKTHEDARQAERKFFAEHPWTTKYSAFKSRFGTANLQEFLSKTLAQKATERMPDIRSEVQDRLAKVERQLNEIPETPSDKAISTISDLVYGFSAEIQRCLEREYGFTDWWDQWEALQKAFAEALESMCPALACKGERDDGIFSSTLPGGCPDDSIVIDESDDDRGAATNVQETPSKRRKREAETPALSPFKTPSKSATKSTINTPTNRARPGRRGRANDPSDLSTYKLRFTLDDLINEIHANSKSRIPGQIHNRLREDLLVRATKEWYRATHLFFETLHNNITAWLNSLIEKHFGGRRSTPLYNHARSIVLEMVQNSLHLQKDVMAADCLRDQQEGPYIFYHQAFEREKDLVLDRYRQARRVIRMRRFIEQKEEHEGREIKDPELIKLRKDENVIKKVNEDPYEFSVFELMAHITAYYKVSSERFHDAICMRVESKFFRPLRCDLRSELISRLGIHEEIEGPLKAQALLVESPALEERRRGLHRERQSLNAALEVLNELDRKYPRNMLDASAGDLAHLGSLPFAPPTNLQATVSDDVEMLDLSIR